MQDPKYPLGTCQCGCGTSTRLAPQTNRSKGWVKGRPLQYALGHQRRANTPPRIELAGHPTPCWIWQGAKMRRGYGTIQTSAGTKPAHRIYYEAQFGPIPAALDLDHLCRNPACVNPNHLEPVTRAENTRRGKSAKLTVTDVQRIRTMRGDGVSQTAVARMFHVSLRCIRSIERRETWKDV